MEEWERLTLSFRPTRPESAVEVRTEPSDDDEDDTKLMVTASYEAWTANSDGSGKANAKRTFLGECTERSEGF